MVERLPKFMDHYLMAGSAIVLVFDKNLTSLQQQELRDLVALQFAGQLRRDPNAPQTKPAEPGA